MKKIGNVLLIILINTVLSFFSLIFYLLTTSEIIERTKPTFGVIAAFFLAVILYGYMKYLRIKNLKKYFTGTFTLAFTFILFLFLFINQNLASNGNFKSYTLIRYETITGKSAIYISYKGISRKIETTIDNCIDVNQVQLRVDRGFFGLPVLTDCVKIIENNNCNFISMDNSLPTDYFESSKILSSNRCFSKAISQISIAIKKDSLSPQYYYQRALLFSVMKKYQSALNDFIISAKLQLNFTDLDSLEQLENLEKFKIIGKIFAENINENQRKIDELKRDYEILNFTSNYQQRINYCLKMLEKEP